MTDINLLPWRERLHQKAKKQWLMGLSMVLVLSLFILVITCIVLNSKIHQTIKINDQLNDPLKNLSYKLQRVKMIESKKTEVASKAKVFQSLQKERFNTMLVLSDLVNQMPSGMYLIVLRKQESQWRLEGVAESFLQISSFMQQLAQIAEIKASKLLQIDTSKSQKDGAQHRFAIVFQTVL